MLAVWESYFQRIKNGDIVNTVALYRNNLFLCLTGKADKKNDREK